MIRLAFSKGRSASKHKRITAVAAAGLGLLAVLAAALGVSPASAQPRLRGLDVSDHQSRVNWARVRSEGAQFAYIKATQGTHFVNPDFARQYNGSYRAGLIRGAYHFALPNRSGGAAQARFFTAHGGAWSADGRTLPGALDIEPNPYGSYCYGMSHHAMVSWITGFTDTYHARTGRWPVIYTTANWWANCTGDYAGFAHLDPLWLASMRAGGGRLPGGWRYFTIWQYAFSGTFPGDQDVFNGPASGLERLALGR
jgi:GH25 family lysozyme M1 (1,4-beta-N-acetylmuramidase)